MGIGDHIHYTDSRGRCCEGLIINTMPARLMDTVTGEIYAVRKFYLWDEAKRRGFWTLAMRATEAE